MELLQDSLCPGLQPGVAILSDLIRRKRRGLLWPLGELCERLGQRHIRQDGEDIHLLRQIGLELWTQHEIHELLCKRALLCALQDADELDLTETSVRGQDGAHGGFGW